MAKKLFVLFTVAIFLFSCAKKVEETKVSEKTNDKPVEKVEAAPPVKVTVEKLYDTPDEYAGKDVEIEGTVAYVCAHRGNMMRIIGTDDKKVVMARVTEKMPKFDMTTMGKDITMLGTFKKQVYDMDYVKKYEEEQKAKYGSEHECTETQSLIKAIEENGGSITDYWIECSEVSVKEGA